MRDLRDEAPPKRTGLVAGLFAPPKGVMTAGFFHPGPSELCFGGWVG